MVTHGGKPLVHRRGGAKGHFPTNYKKARRFFYGARCFYFFRSPVGAIWHPATEPASASSLLNRGK